MIVGYRLAAPDSTLVCTSKARSAKAGTKTLICVPTTTAQELRRLRAMRVRLVLVFTARGAKAQRMAVGVVTMPRIARPGVPVTG